MYIFSRLEEIGALASKEYTLEKNLEKMTDEWADLRFTFTQYRDSVRQIQKKNIILLKSWCCLLLDIKGPT